MTDKQSSSLFIELVSFMHPLCVPYASFMHPLCILRLIRLQAPVKTLKATSRKTQHFSFVDRNSKSQHCLTMEKVIKKVIKRKTKMVIECLLRHSRRLLPSVTCLPSARLETENWKRVWDSVKCDFKVNNSRNMQINPSFKLDKVIYSHKKHNKNSWEGGVCLSFLSFFWVLSDWVVRTTVTESL